MQDVAQRLPHRQANKQPAKIKLNQELRKMQTKWKADNQENAIRKRQTAHTKAKWMHFTAKRVSSEVENIKTIRAVLGAKIQCL